MGEPRRVRVESSVVIHRPVEEVFTFAGEIANLPLWVPRVKEVHKAPEGPWSLGSTARTVRRMLGRRIVFTWEVAEYEPNRKIVLKSLGGPVRAQDTSTFESVEDGTRFTFAFEGELTGLITKLFGPIFVRLFRSELQSDLANLKRLLEARA